MSSVLQKELHLFARGQKDNRKRNVMLYTAVIKTTQHPVKMDLSFDETHTCTNPLDKLFD